MSLLVIKLGGNPTPKQFRPHPYARVSDRTQRDEGFREGWDARGQADAVHGKQAIEGEYAEGLRRDFAGDGGEFALIGALRAELALGAVDRAKATLAIWDETRRDRWEANSIFRKDLEGRHDNA